MVIRAIQNTDIERLVRNFCFPWSNENATLEKWKVLFDEHQNLKRSVYVIEKDQKILGYGNLMYQSFYPNFRRDNIPEINDVWIAEDCRSQGYGTKLIRYLEAVAKEKNYKKIGLGVGLYKEYGNAQKLYYHLGYIPDGHGLTYNYLAASPGNSYLLDDNLLLWLQKDL